MSAKFLITTVSLLCLAGIPAGAQSLLGLNYPMGVPENGTTSISQSLGGTGVAVCTDFLGALNNPANLGGIHRTVFSTGAGATLLSINDGGESTHHLNASLSAISLSVPVSRFGAIAFSVNPESNPAVRFRTVKPFNATEVSTDAVESSLFVPDSVEIGILRTGASLSWQAAWGYDFFRTARFGIALKRYTFTQKTVSQLRMGGTISNRLTDSTDVKYHTYAFRSGVIVPVKQFAFGVTGEYYLIETAKTKQYISGTRASDTLYSPDSFELKPAPSIAFGASWQINPQWLVAADARLQLWSRYYNEFEAPSGLDNAVAVSSGVQFIPAPNLLTPKFWEITQYRAGLRYAQLPGAEGSETAVTLAAGLPMQGNTGLVDIMFEFARRTDYRFNDIHENIVGLKIGINAGRKWYQTDNGSY